jgi:hypothetical protein
MSGNGGSVGGGINVRLDVRVPAPVRRWHIDLVRRLSAVPSLSVRAVGPLSDDGTEPAVDRVISYERLLHRAGGQLWQPASAEELNGWSPNEAADGARAPELIIDLTGNPIRGNRVWRLEFEGRAGSASVVDALRRNGTARVVVLDDQHKTVAEGRPGSETPGVLATALDDTLAGCIQLIEGAVRSSPFAAPAPACSDGAAEPPSLLRHAARQTVRAAAHRAYRALYRAPHWRIGWRWTDGPGLLVEPGELPAGWNDLPDDGLHFYADPFPFAYGGTHHLFVEDFEHRLGRGVIAVTEFGENGPLHPPVPVLQHDVHLSYPFVLEDEGEVWMIPETSGAGTVELYRAERFPHRWTQERVLLEGLEASDATVFRHADRWWMMATVRNGGSFSDALHLWHADRLTGPWSAHPNNPVLIDISSARPAGRVEELDGRLIRPVQDGRHGYGAALGVVEISELTETSFQQRLLRRLAPGSWWPGRRLHTLNRSGRLECIDGSAMSPRFRRIQHRRQGAE